MVRVSVSLQSWSFTRLNAGMDHSFIPVPMLYVIVAGTTGKAAMTQLAVNSGQTKETTMLKLRVLVMGFAAAKKSFVL